ncbi:MAG: alpha/beta fold hydrolase [Pseudomonadota bacterium]
MNRVFLAVVLQVLVMLVPATVRGEVLVLVHGYLSGANYWDESGVTTILQQHGWQRAGVYSVGPGGAGFVPAPGLKAGNKFYTVDLPSEAPVLVQVYQLQGILDAIARRHGAEPEVLVGHSAGGVVARTALVRGKYPAVKALVTIATPHLGTVRAEQALDATDIPFPFSLLTDFFGGDLYDTAMRSRGLYVDLVRPQPGSLLFWLNGQPHPDIKYVSIVRADTPAGWGDYVVPAYSQDMNNVPALRGRARLVTIPAEHGLGPQDGSVLVRVLADLK